MNELDKIPNNYLIEKFSPEDAKFVKRIEQESGLSSWSLRDYESEPNRDDSISLIARCVTSKKVLGFGIIRVPNVSISSGIDIEAELLNFAVSKPFRLEGIGQKLLRALGAEARNRSAKKLFLDVRESNDKAIGFYEHAGFKKIGSRKNFYSNPKENAVLMVLELT